MNILSWHIWKEIKWHNKKKKAEGFDDAYYYAREVETPDEYQSRKDDRITIAIFKWIFTLKIMGR